MAVTFKDVLAEQQDNVRKSNLTNVATTVIMVDEDIAKLTAIRAELIAMGEAEVIDIARLQKLRGNLQKY